MTVLEILGNDSQILNINNLEKLTNGGCFIAGTVIFTDEGKEEIEDIQEGDYVYARDQYGEIITTTEEHPFYIEGEGFVEASELEVGDLAETADGETVPIEAVEEEYLEEPVTVYNFEVEDYHTYYVGNAEILVHNTCMVGGNGTKGVSKPNIKYDYNMIENPGPLAKIDGQPASNFYGGKYNTEVLTEDRIYYRAGQDGKPLGQWFTSEPAESVAKVRIDTAVKEQWIDQFTGEITGTSIIDTNYAIKIPKGTTVYTGPVGY